MSESSLNFFSQTVAELDGVLLGRVEARVRQVIGLVIETTPLATPVGSLCRVFPAAEAIRGEMAFVEVEVVGFREDCALLMPYAEIRGVAPGDPTRGLGR